MISLVDKNNPVNKRLILIDEPEVGLHPSSANDLKNKLVKLGENNLVIYATHSISMIDTENIKNNLIVSKQDEDTTIETAKEDGAASAENIYKAIGYSIYQELKKNNLIVEGYTDKKIIEPFMNKTSWKNIGVCYMNGIKNVQLIIAILDLGGRNYHVLSDTDEPAKNKKQEMRNIKRWFTYEDLDCDAITIEDFYTPEFFSKIVQKVFEEHGAGMPDNIPENGRIDFIKTHLYKNGITTGKEIIKAIKKELVNKRDKSDIIEEKMRNMLKSLRNKMNSETESE